MRTSIRSGGSLLILLAVVAFGALAWGFLAAAAARDNPDTGPGGGPGTTVAGADVTLRRTGLEPSSLAAVGATASLIPSLIGQADQHLGGHSAELAACDASCIQARQTVDRLEDLIEAGLNTEADIAALQAARAALSQARTQQQALLEACFAASSASLSEPQRLTLRRIRENRRWELPTEFLVLGRSEQEWVTLRDALANERYSQQYGEPMDPAAAQFLAQVRAAAEVAQASAGINTNLASISSAWNSATAD